MKTQKEILAESYVENQTLLKRLEKRKEEIRSALLPLMEVGEKVLGVEKIRSERLNIDPALLDKLESELGPKVVERKPNIKVIRALLGPEAYFLPKTQSEFLRLEGSDD